MVERWFAGNKLAILFILMFLLPELLFTIPRNSTAQDDPFAGLDSCLFNAYTERDDLIIGAVVLNMETGAGCTQNLNSTFPIASVGKLFVAAALYEQVASGRAAFEDEITFTADYLMDGRSDCLRAEHVGLRYTLGYLGNIMISCSDNSATWLLMDYLSRDTIRAYIESLNIPGIGEVIPYAEVDQLKLIYLDSRWENVPRALASQYYRRRIGEGLVPLYFDSVPRYSGEQFREANDFYLENYTFNTATPRAITTFMLKLRDDLNSDNSVKRTTARWLFNTMLLTQRVYSTQYMPGTVYVGSKNGFDLGYRAEVNVTIQDFDTYSPTTISLVFARHRDVTIRELAPFRFENVPTTDFLLGVAPRIAGLLFPVYDPTIPPVTVSDPRVRQVLVNTNEAMFPCYQNFVNYDYLAGLQRCWGAHTSIDRLSGDDLLGVGAILRDLYGDDARLTIIFYQPDGRPRAYQMQAFFKDATALAWFEDVSISGVWRVDVFFNLAPVYTQAFFVG